MAQKKSPPASAKAPARGSKPVVAPSAGPKAGARRAPKATRPAQPTRSAPANTTSRASSGSAKAPTRKGTPAASAQAPQVQAPRGKVVPQSASGADPRRSRGKDLKSDARAPKTGDMSSAAPAKKERSTPKTYAAAQGSGKGAAKATGARPTATAPSSAKGTAASKGASPKPDAPKASKPDAKAKAGKGADKTTAKTTAKTTNKNAAKNRAARTTASKANDAQGKRSKGGRANAELEATEAPEGADVVETEEEELSEADAKEAEELDPVLKLKIPEIEEPKAARVSIRPKNPNRPTLAELRQMPTEDIWGYYRRAATAAKRDEKYIEEMRNVLMELHLPLVKHIAERLLQTLPKSIELGDLESAGSFGLMDAIRGFDPDRGIKFKTYCTTRIRGSILDMLRSQDWVPRLVRLKASRIEKTLQRLQGEYGREPTHAELASALDMDHAALSVELSQSRAKTMFSLSERWDDRDDDSGGEKIEIVEDAKAVDPVFELNRRDLMLHITKSLSHKERFIIEQYYDVGHTMREIGEMLALTESRVCQIHSNVMARLKDLLNPGSSNLES